MKLLRFVKMEGAGNDYVYVNGFVEAFPLDAPVDLVVRLADRHFGVGGDGVILLAPSSRADVRMVMWNADGSRGGMCGNGIRCVAKLAHDEGLVTGDRVRVETEGGIRGIDLVFAAETVVGARVDMGEVRVETTSRTLSVDGRSYPFLVGDAGNPHAVVFVSEDPAHLPVEAIGRAFQRTPPFTDGVNVEFVRIAPDGTLVQRTWERGSGETLACGSGATVAALAALRTGRVPGPSIKVRLRGGELTIHVADGRVVMEGPAREVFRGTIDLDRRPG